ncbi:conserved hypothetical protein [Rhodococcus jostii RHA1]|uniref:Uncharacterized protein n=1 Tax=Rhodococcus jostii (strain RHA1) TaxID=101510 RepID=Q0S5F8_RHOJR|nr:conserved hypothetical protein [Rhodococcus jostii RHA1]
MNITDRHSLAELRERFDYVIVDASPLLPVTDAAVLTTMFDGALVIARHAETKREQLSRAVGNLHGVGATILGTITTMAPCRGRGVYEYKYYYETDTAAPLAPQAGQPHDGQADDRQHAFVAAGEGGQPTANTSRPIVGSHHGVTLPPARRPRDHVQEED